MAQLNARQQERTIINDPASPSFDPNKFTIEVLPDGSERIINVNNVDPGLFLIQPLGGAAQDAMPSMEQGQPPPMAIPEPMPPAAPGPQPETPSPPVPASAPAPLGPEAVTPTQGAPPIDAIAPTAAVPPTAAVASPMPTIPTIAAGATQPLPPPPSPAPKRQKAKRAGRAPARRPPSYTVGHGGPRL